MKTPARAERGAPAAPPRLVLAACLLLLAAGPAFAERTDRDKPVYLEADSGTFDDSKKTAVFTGNVVLTQGTLTIKAERMVVKQDAAGFQQGTAYGSPAYFRQKRDGYEEYIEGWAQRMEYNSRSEMLELFDQARMVRGRDEVRGNYISYNAQTELFRVLGGGKEEAAKGESRGRVRAVIQPKPRDDGAPPAPASGAAPAR